MNVAEITAKTHRYTRTTNTSGYSDADILIDLNLIKNEINFDILRWQGYKEVLDNTATLDLADWTGVSAGALGYNGEIPFPTDLLTIKRLEISIDGVMTPVTIYHDTDNSLSENDDINTNFDSSTPYAIISRGGFRLRPIPSEAVTGGLLITYAQRQADLTTGSPILEPSFHRIFPLLLAYEYGLSQLDKINPLWEQEINKLKKQIRSFYSFRYAPVMKLRPRKVSGR